jgi:hypothetical protein
MNHGRIREDRVEGAADRGDHVLARSMRGRPEIALRDHMIVGVMNPVAGLPMIAAALLEDRILVALLAAGVREARHSHPEGTLLPAARIARLLFHVRGDVLTIEPHELPVRHSRGQLQHFGAGWRLRCDGDRRAQREHADQGAWQGIPHEPPFGLFSEPR